MAIETSFRFDHQFSRTATIVDLLGPLRGFIGEYGKRCWKGTGFNLLWRPNFRGQSGPKDFFLELNLTEETLEFTDITGNGIANRGLLQADLQLGGLAYLQQIKDRFDHSNQHFEPGVWVNVPATTNPEEKSTVVRMGSIPHGTTINLQGAAFEAPDGQPRFSSSSITPFAIGSPDDGKTGLVHFDEEDLSKVSASRTERTRVVSLTQEQLSNPNLLLAQAIAGRTISHTTVLVISSDTAVSGGVPNAGGGTGNIAFLAGVGAPPHGGPNAHAARVTATFWIEEIKDQDGKKFSWLQYTQRVLLNFNGLSWPHVSVATLTPA
jgi:hypothetical protein